MKIMPLWSSRHDAIAYAFKDGLWAKYNFGEFFKADDPLTKKPATRNPFNNPKPGDYKVPGVGPVQIGINELQAAGVKFCVCEMAMIVNSNIMAEKIKKDADEIRKDWIAGLLPGVQPVPSGVWALAGHRSMAVLTALQDRIPEMPVTAFFFD